MVQTALQALAVKLAGLLQLATTAHQADPASALAIARPGTSSNTENA